MPIDWKSINYTDACNNSIIIIISVYPTKNNKIIILAFDNFN